MINTCLVCFMFGIVVGVLASYLYKRDEIIDNLVKVDTNDGWHWTIWKKTIIDGTLATLKKGNKEATIVVDDNKIVIMRNKKIFYQTNI